MRILISADMEGATGVTCPDDVLPGGPGWERMRPLFTDEVNAAVEGLHRAGARDIVVNDAHWTMRNLMPERFEWPATVITGRHKPLSMMEGVQDADAVVFLGYHAGAGMEGVLAHTYLANTITGVWLDGVRASEGRLNAAVAAEFGVPVIMVTGDDKTVHEAEDYAPKAVGVAVKDCLSRYAAACRTPKWAIRAIRKGASEAVALAGRREPVQAGPHRIEVEFDADHLAGAVTVIPGVEPSGERRVAFELPTMYEAIRCFKAVTTIASASTEEQYG
ncbi:M55 family metallopeptidase [Glycomyces sp. TRM65418]|uniref:M55 family metallopeptidase n=1 Tax=Glycomyces sp. TRM65418 TaxID=2867006 RepID=UPI001CE6E941|nr:M55 family metallopeptidase [Glycomyces sp. TRM65418]MCC3765302.1 M55 family metallopeptidase [Glycomyces sp. TRM65418]QZD54920.1 M55 family metallopeptidase [Glycomyces sp. TRM65418]